MVVHSNSFFKTLGPSLLGMNEYLSYVGGVHGVVAAAGAAAALGLTYMFGRSATPIEPLVSLDNQSRLVSGLERIRTSRLCHDGKHLEYLYEDCRTLFDVMYRGARVSNNGPCMGWRVPGSGEYKWIHYNQVLERIKCIACGLVKLGEKPGQQTFIGLYTQNCVEWIITEQACYYFSMIIVPLYDTLGAPACAFIMNQADIETVVCDTQEKVECLLKQASQTPKLKRIVVIKDVSEDVKQKAQEANIMLMKFSELEELGEKNFRHPLPPHTSDLATVCYTSGTTGNPKGVMLTHLNIISDLSAVMYQLGDLAPKGDDVMMSFLPLAHMLERCCEMAIYMIGGRVGFFSGDIKELGEDMKALRPTISPTVPRLLNRIHDKVISACSGSLMKRTLLNMALKSKAAELENCIVRQNSIWDSLVFKSVHESMGGRLRLMVVGSAPLAPNVITFVRCALGAVIVEGYGQTECTAPCTLTFPGDYNAGHVGPPIAACSVKLVDVPDMEYYANNNEGEICVKGPTVFQGYLKDNKKTSEVLDKDGWLHTGDIGKWLDNGCLRVIDRKKHIFKLSQGEYIAPEKLENIFIRSLFVAQIFVHGESLKSCLVAVVIPDQEYLMHWARENCISGTYKELCRNNIVKKSILDDLSRLGKVSGLKSFELLKDIHVHHEALSVENGLLTPTLKTKRPECRKYFLSQIETMYRSLA
ncbi:long-chain-fatty-acid--CoA ligase 5 isoform X2 [Ixodes scapularis]|uniref:long-chain-fatty-acid--CoA ligase 5 isoform X2 n=1 Tax=Ixodes scapularis TaxID=6945 RepID=UPI001C3829B2|nr:long-chain-fatty-acid--CoA ligase 5 isoform X2 [Ixodes scapularis]